jgi:hypothetical protein
MGDNLYIIKDEKKSSNQWWLDKNKNEKCIEFCIDYSSLGLIFTLRKWIFNFFQILFLFLIH